MMAKVKEVEFAGTGDRCSSCNTSIVNEAGAVKFSCPGCSKSTIMRCSKCRKIVTKYVCQECGFVGPN
jgi:Zn-ribbon RNA-binding protein